MPSFDDLTFHIYPDELIERAKKILLILELTEWKWDINKVLEQPDPELSAVFMLKAIGEKVRTHNRRKNNPDAEQI